MTELPAPRMTCRELVDLLTAYLDGGLPAEQRDRVRAHLATCPECIAYLAQMRMTLRVLARLRP